MSKDKKPKTPDLITGEEEAQAVVVMERKQLMPH